MVRVVVCGTPGTGKSTLLDKLKPKLSQNGYKFINLSQFAIEKACTLDYDEELQSHTIDEDQLSEMIEPVLRESRNIIIESIHADLIPANLIDLIFVCRTDNTKLFDRLKARKYSEKKISENIQAEIFQTILDEARVHLGIDDDDVVHKTSLIELSNNDHEELDSNVQLMVDKIQSVC